MYIYTYGSAVCRQSIINEDGRQEIQRDCKSKATKSRSRGEREGVEMNPAA